MAVKLILCFLVVISIAAAFPLTKNIHPGSPRYQLSGTKIGRYERGASALQLLPGSTLPFVKEAFIVNSAIATALVAVKQKSLTPTGLLHAYALGVGLWTFLDFNGWIVCVTYLILGSLVTKVKIAEKQKLGIAEKREGRRGPENVWGSAATAMVCAIASYLLPGQSALWKIAFVASISSKLSDTFGSELGKAYGRTTYLITTLRLVPRGTEGAVSLEGTAAGIFASIVISALAYAVGVLHSSMQILLCVAAAFIATTIESYIGAVFQDNFPWLTNELVNLIMTIIGAAAAVAGAVALGIA